MNDVLRGEFGKALPVGDETDRVLGPNLTQQERENVTLNLRDVAVAAIDGKVAAMLVKSGKPQFETVLVIRALTSALAWWIDHCYPKHGDRMAMWQQVALAAVEQRDSEARIAALETPGQH